MLLPTIVPVITFANGSAIYLSSIHPIVGQTQELQHEDIQVVISLLEEISAPTDVNDALKEVPGLRHYYYTAKDTPNEPIRKLFLSLYGIIFRALEYEKRVLIYCRTGQSLCVSILISFFILSLYKCVYRYLTYNYVDYIPKNKFTWTESFLEYIQSVYPSARPNDGFIQALIDFENELLGDLQ